MTHGIDWDDFYPTDEDIQEIDISEDDTEECINEDEEVIIATDNEYNTKLLRY